MSAEHLRVVIADTEEELLGRLSALFPDADVSRDGALDAVADQAAEEAPDLLIVHGGNCDPRETANMEALRIIGNQCPGMPLVLLLEAGSIGAAAPLLRSENCRYAKLPLGDEELRLLVEEAQQNAGNRGGRRTGRRRRSRYHGIIGQTAKMQELYRLIRQAALTDIPVLIVGETGTGKDLVAQAIHRESSRGEGAYVPVHLASLPSELVASELFGHEKGAFTGATDRRAGRFEEAQDGTIFLDEIGSISEKVQVSLLRLIEQKVFHRLGGRERISADARIIAATNEDLADAVSEGRFREDLYYRMDVFRITVPALRKRRRDIPVLIEEFLRRFNRKFRKEIAGISPQCVALLESFRWPGNVRELKNVIQRAALVCNGDTILPEHLPPRFQEHSGGAGKVTFEVGTPLAVVEREMIAGALRAAGNNRKRAAEMLGISRRSLYNKLKKYGIK